MKVDTIRTFLRPYSIYMRRSTTISHAFASAIAPVELYNEKKIADALKMLGLNPSDLKCAYCEKEDAETWDHAYALVKKGNFSGYGHNIGNLIPCCKRCNSKKGNKDWEQYITELYTDNKKREKKINEFRKYFEIYSNQMITYDDIVTLCPDEMNQLSQLKHQIFTLMKEADDVSEKIRKKIQLR